MNKFSKLALIFTVCAGMTACSGGIVTQGDYHVIPLPKEITPERKNSRSGQKENEETPHKYPGIRTIHAK